MSGNLEHINQRKRHGNNSRSGNLAAWRDSKKKAKLLIAESNLLVNVLHVEKFQEMIIERFVGHVDARTAQ